MKIYLIRILQNNDEKELMTEEISNVLKENKAGIYQQTIEESMKYIISFGFMKREQREKTSDKMQSIRYEYEDIEVPERAIQEKTINSIYTGYENCKRKSKATEIMLENKLRERDIKYFKTILKKIVVYDFLDINKRIRRFII